MANSIEAYRKFTAARLLLLIIGASVLGVLALLAISLGAAHIGVGDLALTLISRVAPGFCPETDWVAQAVVWDLRMPRILTALVAGAGLALAGAVMQCTLRNPLASPFTLGIAAAAGFGAALAIVLGVGFAGAGKYVIIANAFCFSLLAVFLVYTLSTLRGVTSETLVLAGIAFNFLFGAFSSLLQYFGRSEDVKAVVFWLMGSLHAASWERLLPVSGVFLICFPLLMRYCWDLNALALGDDTARSLGTRAERVRVVAMVLATLVTASIICFTGIIGFVCLIAPHMVRMIIGPDHRFLLPGSCITGAILLLGADSVARTVAAPIEIPVGIVTSLLGVPLFVYLLLTRRAAYWRGG